MASIIHFKIGDHVSWNSEVGMSLARLLKNIPAIFNLEDKPTIARQLPAV